MVSLKRGSLGVLESTRRQEQSTIARAPTPVWHPLHRAIKNLTLQSIIRQSGLGRSPFLV
jgi:hypothetical protein